MALQNHEELAHAGVKLDLSSPVGNLLKINMADYLRKRTRLSGIG